MDIITTAVTPITLDTGKIVHAVKVDFTERRFPPTVKIVQYDKSLPVIAASLYQGGAVYTIPAGAAVNIRVRKPDNTYVYNGAIGCDTARHVAYFEVSEQMAAAYGDGRATVELVVNGEIAGTSLILLQIEENPVPEDAIESSDEYQTIYDLYDMIKSTIVNPVTLASEMTDTSIVYLYIGDETGYNKGHMYFYNGTTWVDAGICSTDTTLSISGMAADAKATGDAIATKQNTLTFDSAPTNGSTNPVTSGGVYTAVKTVNDSVTELGEELTDTQTDVSALQERLLSAFATDTASGTVATFSDGADGVPVKSLSVAVEAVQSGSGDPSPSNVRPISGWDKIHVYVDAVHGTHDKTYTVDLPQTVYGGTLDVSTGVLTVDHVMVDLGTLNWRKSTSSTQYRTFSANVDNLDYSTNVPTVIADCYMSAAITSGVTADGDNYIYVRSASTTQRGIAVKDTSKASMTAAEYTTAISGHYAVYKMSTPTTLTLTPTEVATLLGQNNIYADSGEVAVTYRADTGLYIDKRLNA